MMLERQANKAEKEATATAAQKMKTIDIELAKIAKKYEPQLKALAETEDYEARAVLIEQMTEECKAKEAGLKNTL